MLKRVGTITLALLGFVVCLGARGQDAEVQLRFANILNDHMVLQQQKSVRIWGRAKPGAAVRVVLTEGRAAAVKLVGEPALSREAPEQAADGEKPRRVRFRYEEENALEFAAVATNTVADVTGCWEVILAPLTASFTPKFLLAVSGDARAALIDVLVGEVWVTAGQSNMAWGGNRTGWLDTQGLLAPGVRYAHTGRVSKHQPLDDLVERATWMPCTEENVKGISTIPYLFGKFLHRKLQVPVGIINAASGGAQANYWSSLDELHAIDFWAVKELMAEHDTAIAEWEDEAKRKQLLAKYEEDHAKLVADWKQESEAAKAAGKRAPKEPPHRPPKGPRSRFLASYLFNGRIAPIGKLPVRGALYLQGEQQVLTWCVSRYEYVLPAVIRSFRSAFGEEDLPFGIIALQGAGHNKVHQSAVDSVDRTAVVRDIQFRTHQSMTNSGYICSHDVGRGLHPNWKRPVAERAVYWALQDVYGQIPRSHVGLKAVEFKDGKGFVYIEQDTITRKRGKDRQTIETPGKKHVRFATWSGNDGCPLDGFMIAGEDRRWYPAKVKPGDKTVSLVVSSDLVPEPVAVRYGWGSFVPANVGPWEDPLPPFRTDDWPLPESYNVKPDMSSKYRSLWYAQIAEQYSTLLDGVIRQGRIDAAICELKLHTGAPDIVLSKLQRIEAILGELDPALYQGDSLRYMDERDWKIRRQDEARLKRADAIAKEMETVLADPEIKKQVESIRSLLKAFGKTVKPQ